MAFVLRVLVIIYVVCTVEACTRLFSSGRNVNNCDITSTCINQGSTGSTGSFGVGTTNVCSGGQTCINGVRVDRPRSFGGDDMENVNICTGGSVCTNGRARFVRSATARGRKIGFQLDNHLREELAGKF